MSHSLPEETTAESVEKKPPAGRKLGLSFSTLAWALPIAAGLVFTVAFFQAYLFSFPLLTQLLTLLSVLLWSVGFAAGIACFFVQRRKSGFVGLAVSLVAAPLIPFLLLMSVSGEARRDLAEGGLAFADEIGSLLDSGSGVFSEVDDVDVNWKQGQDSFIGSPIELSATVSAMPVQDFPLQKVIWTADGQLAFFLVDGVGPGNGYKRIIGFDMRSASCIADVSLVKKAHISVTAHELVILPNGAERIVMLDPKTLKRSATLRVRDAGKGWVATHPMREHIAVGTGSIESAHVIHIPTRRGVGIIERSDYPISESAGSKCKVQFGDWAFSSDGQYLMSASWKSRDQRTACDAFLEINDDDVVWVGYRREVDSLESLQPFDNRFVHRHEFRKNRAANNSASTGPLISMDGKLHELTGGEKRLVSWSDPSSEEPTPLEAISISPSGTSALAVAGTKAFLISIRP